MSENGFSIFLKLLIVDHPGLIPIALIALVGGFYLGQYLNNVDPDYDRVQMTGYSTGGIFALLGIPYLIIFGAGDKSAGVGGFLQAASYSQMLGKRRNRKD